MWSRGAPTIIVASEAVNVRPTRDWCGRLALLVLLLGAACARPAVSPPTASLGQLIGEYERETTPYYPFTASERGLHQYDRVLANDIGDDYRRGLQEICTPYRGEVRRPDAPPFRAKDPLPRAAFPYRFDGGVESLDYRG